MTPDHEQMSTLQGLRSIVERLRGPQGCPWDREQTHASLKRNLLEETYEVLEAIDRGDAQSLCEELGDLLVQVAFHAHIAQQAGEFTLEEVFRRINQKLIHRHPHVFGDAQVATAAEVEERWDAIKRRERGGASSLDRVPKELPALAYSQVIQDRAARLGFDRPEPQGALDKLAEELQELQHAPAPETQERALGDVLLSLVNVARHMGIHAESALLGANRRFYEGFLLMERLCHQRGRSLAHLPPEEQERLWQEARARLAQRG